MDYKEALKDIKHQIDCFANNKSDAYKVDQLIAAAESLEKPY